MNSLYNKQVPEISVLMSCYNAERWLAEAIESVLTQSFKDFEFIIVNDGSSDSTSEVIAKYSMQDPRIVVINKPNSGLADSLNRGIRKARGKWIARIDADDICEVNRLKHQLAYILKHQDTVLLGSGFVEIDHLGRFVKEHNFPPYHAKLVHRLERHQAFFAHSSAFYKTSVVQALGGYRICFKAAQDWDLWLRLSEMGKIGSISAPLVRIRKHKNQISLIESGRRQLLDAYAATISYFIRKLGGKDPVADENDIKVKQFFEWTGRQLSYKGIFDRRSAWSEARTAYFAQDKPLKGIFIFGAKLVSSGHAIPLLNEKLFGTDLPKRLAKEWLKTT